MEKTSTSLVFYYYFFLEKIGAFSYISKGEFFDVKRRMKFLHSCKETPTLDTPEDEGWEEFLVGNYTFIKRLGILSETEVAGSSGIAMELLSSSGTVVAKLMGMDKDHARYSINDVTVGCKLNKIRDKTPIFIETFGWLRCPTYPDAWKRRAGREPPEYNEKNGILIEFISHAPQAFSDMDILFSLEEYIELTIILLHGLMIADKAFEFKHNDIHLEQILLSAKAPGTGPTSVEIDGKVYNFKVQFDPILIDYGHSLAKGTAFGTPNKTKDISDLLTTIQQRMFRQIGNEGHMTDDDIENRGAQAFKKFSNRHRATRYASDALKDSFITEFLKRRIKSINFPIVRYMNESSPLLVKMNTCLVCNKPASLRCKGCKSVFYCNSECATKGWISGHNEECSNIVSRVPSGVKLEDLYEMYTGGNKDQRLAFKWLLERRLSPDWNPTTLVTEDWASFLKSPRIREYPTKENDRNAIAILNAFKIPYHHGISPDPRPDLRKALLDTMAADALIDVFEKEARDNEGEEAVKIVDTIVDEVQRGVDDEVEEKVDEIKDATSELGRKIKSAELTMLAMEKELETLRSLVTKHEERNAYLEKSLEQCREDWEITKKQSADREIKIQEYELKVESMARRVGTPPPRAPPPQAPPMAPPSSGAGPPPPPAAPPPMIVNLPDKPLAGVTESLKTVQLRTAEISPAAKFGAEKTENALLAQIERFAKGKLRSASSRTPNKKPTPSRGGGGFMGDLAAAMAKRRKGVQPDEETDEEKSDADAAFELNGDLVMAVIQGKHFRERARTVIGDRFFV